MTEKREKAGKIAYDLFQKNESKGVTAEDQMRENLTDYEKNFFEALDRGKKTYINLDFYVVVLQKTERLMQNVHRNYFLARLSCPTPNYDQIVYRYSHKDDNFELVWVLPSRQAAFYLKRNALLLDEKEKDLLKYVLMWSDGSLNKLCKQLNGEKLDSSFLES